MFTNRHVVIALLVAPVLSVLAWIAVGQLAVEKAAPAQVGKAYPLVAASNCRWESGECRMENKELSLVLRFSESGALEVRSGHPLQRVLVSLVAPDAAPDAYAAAAPQPLRQSEEDGRLWRSAPLASLSDDARLRIVVEVAGSRFYGETETRFANANGEMDRAYP